MPKGAFINKTGQKKPSASQKKETECGGEAQGMGGSQQRARLGLL